MSTHGDRRQHGRVNARDYALMFVPDYPDPVSAVVTDMSLGGLRAKTKVPVPEGIRFLMHLFREDHVPIVAAVEVKHCILVQGGSFLVGVRFLPGTSEQRMALVEFLQDTYEECHLKVA